MTRLDTDMDTGGAAGDPEVTFADVFRDALRRRGLSLERVRHRLQTQGIGISLATLSYWQRGRSQPERAKSLRAVDALEEILALPPALSARSCAPAGRAAVRRRSCSTCRRRTVSSVRTPTWNRLSARTSRVSTRT